MTYNSMELARIKNMVVDIVTTYGKNSEQFLTFKYFYEKKASYKILRQVYETFTHKKGD